jgi:hypothetical protein
MTLFKQIVITFNIFLLTFIFTDTVFANNDFETSANIEYKINESGITFVTSSILIKNKTSLIYPEKLILTIDNLKSENLKVHEEGSELEPQIDPENPQKIILNFKNKTAGIDKIKSILVTYQSPDIAIRSGDIWGLQIPQILDKSSLYDNVTIRVLVPKVFGSEAIVNPEPKKVLEEKDFFVYTFSDSTGKLNRGINMSFGKFQYFNFNLKYHLSPENSVTEIPLPPDTSLQKIFIKNITPIPSKVFIDDDGNWIASFIIKNGKALDIEVSGSAKIFSAPIRYLPSPGKDYLDKNLLPSKYWDIADTKLNLLAQQVNSPYDIYKLTSDYLNYDPSRAFPDAKRLGSSGAINNPQNALCTEYSDLFIALSRAKGIPAREIQGFAQTDNSEVMPLSLVNDVLHSWVEYWDEKQGLWIPADPTWASTNKNVEYFNNLDMKHLAFVIHGTHPEKPLPPGSYKLGDTPQKDVFVSYGTYDSNEFHADKLETTYEFNTGLNLFKKTLKLSIKNVSTEALYGKSVDIVIDNVSKSETITLPPYGEFNKNIDIQYGIFGLNAPKNVLLFVDGEKIDLKMDTEFNLYRDLSIISVFLAFVTFAVLLKVKAYSRPI